MTIVWFNEIGTADRARVGGKGANLGEMARAGFPVPPGFCVTTAAYQQVIAGAGLWPAIEALLASEPVDVAAAQIRRLIEAAPIPADLVHALHAAYARLSGANAAGAAPVAVRSSATAEDLAEASFAGQQETYLGVRGAEQVTAAVQRCWASLWTQRAIVYRERNGFCQREVTLAVVVQALIAPDSAGVLFTANPITGARGELVVNASYGLGESVVSGRVTPDTYRLTRRLRVLERTCGAKASRLDAAPAGGTRVTPVPGAERDRLCLSASQLRALARLGLRVERHYAKPQDIEWAFVGDRVYLLQARPITALAALPGAPGTPRAPGRLESALIDDIREHYPDPPYPLDYEAVTASYQQLLDALTASGFVIPRAEDIIRLDAGGRATLTPFRPRPSRGLLKGFTVLRAALRIDPNEWHATASVAFAATLAALKATQLVEASNADLAEFLTRAVAVATDIGAIRFRRYIIPSLMRSAELRLLLALAGETHSDVFDLLGELEYRTALIDQALQRLAHAANALPTVRAQLLERPASEVLAALESTPEARVFRDRLQAFLREHGARTMKAYLPFSNRSWAEEPAALLATLAVLVRSGAPAPRARFHEARARIARRLPAPLRARFHATLARFRAGHVAREATLYAIEEAFALARRGAAEAGARLVQAGALADPDEVRFLTLSELCALLRGEQALAGVAALVERRRQARPGAVAAWHAHGRARRAEHAPGGRWRGQPGSPGMATGPAKVISGPAEFGKLQAGDVLVCPFTDPAWTPLFALAAAVVADTGGPLSHAAIVAREYGIPAVLGTRTGTAHVHDGDVLTVDGRRGEVVRA